LYAISQAKSLGLSNAHAFYGYRSLQIFKIFKTIFNTSSSSIKCIISAQAVNVWTAQQIFNNNPELSKYTDFLAIAPYYDCGNIGTQVNSASILANSNGNDDLIINWCNSNMS
jgi:hypothetical protein